MNTANRRKILFAGKGIKTVDKHQIHFLLGDFNLILAAFTCKFTMIQEHRSWLRGEKYPPDNLSLLHERKKKRITKCQKCYGTSFSSQKLVKEESGSKECSVLHFQETKHFPPCLYFYRGHIHQGRRKVLLCRNNPQNWESAEILLIYCSPHHSGPCKILFPETTGHLEEAYRSHLTPQVM